MKEIPADKPVYVICQSGLRSYIASASKISTTDE